MIKACRTDKEGLDHHQPTLGLQALVLPAVLRSPPFIGSAISLRGKNYLRVFTLFPCMYILLYDKESREAKVFSSLENVVFLHLLYIFNTSERI